LLSSEYGLDLWSLAEDTAAGATWAFSADIPAIFAVNEQTDFRLFPGGFEVQQLLEMRTHKPIKAGKIHLGAWGVASKHTEHNCRALSTSGYSH
jgi:hypothetical protein